MRAFRGIQTAWTLRRFLVGTCLVSCLLLSHVNAQQNETQVWAVPSVQKVRPDDPVEKTNLVWSEETKTITVAGARSEHVPFQLVISTPPPLTRSDPAASGFWVESSDLVSNAGRIDSERTQIFFEHVVLCYGKSSPVGETGFWPDALAPLREPFDMAAAFRRSIRNRVLWFDITVPEDAAPGTYQGTIRVSQNAVPVDQVTISLTVYDFALPEETHFLAFIGIFENWFAPHYNLDSSSPDMRLLLRKYYDFLYQRRMEPWFNRLLQPEIREAPDGQIVIDFDDDSYHHYLNVLKAKRVFLHTVPHQIRRDDRFEEFSEPFNERVRSYLRQATEYFRKRGWLGRLIFNSPIDEPNTAEQYANTRKWAELVHEAAPGVPFLVTESPLPDRPEWGTLRGYADNFCVHGNALNDSAVKQAIREEEQKGGEMTWYISCDQRYPQPNYFIDAPAMDPVMVPWITWRYGMDGILYWAANYWTQTPDPWLNPVTFLSGFFCSRGGVLNGEGSLLYPGNRTRRHTGQPNVDGPVSSIRLELLREGIEDHEYLWLLKSLGDENFANQAGQSMVVNVSAFSRNVEELFALREKLARRIESIYQAGGASK